MTCFLHLLLLVCRKRGFIHGVLGSSVSIYIYTYKCWRAFYFQNWKWIICGKWNEQANILHYIQEKIDRGIPVIAIFGGLIQFNAVAVLCIRQDWRDASHHNQLFWMRHGNHLHHYVSHIRHQICQGINTNITSLIKQKQQTYI